MPTLIDTNVLIDLFGQETTFTLWSEKGLHACRAEGPVAIDQIIYAEMAAGFETVDELDSALTPSRFLRESIPFEAGPVAGKAYAAYRRQGGDRRSPLPDFYVGAHALVAGHRLLTRDPARYRTYFPAIEIIAPDTHP